MELKHKFHGDVAKMLREEIGRVGRVTRMLRRCYEETIPMEYRLNCTVLYKTCKRLVVNWTSFPFRPKQSYAQCSSVKFAIARPRRKTQTQTNDKTRTSRRLLTGIRLISAGDVVTMAERRKDDADYDVN